MASVTEKLDDEKLIRELGWLSERQKGVVRREGVCDTSLVQPIDNP